MAAISPRRRVYLVLAAVLVAGAILRVHWNDVAEYARSDETVYLISARTLASSWSSYPQLVREYIADPSRQLFPLPSRWGGLVITSAACVIAPCTHRTLAWVETIAGIAAILLTFLAARSLFGDRAGLVAAVLTVTSPIQLAMGRRALEDELFLVAILLALWSSVAIAKARVDSARVVALGVAAFTLAFALKEVFTLYYPAFAAMLIVLRADHRPRVGDFLLFVLPPFVFAAVFWVLSGDVLHLLTLARIQQSMRGNEYIAQFQSGPFYEPLLDLYVLAPLVTAAGLVAGGLALRDRRGRDAIAATIFVALLLASYGLIPKDARYFIPADAGFRMLIGWGLGGIFSLASLRTWAIALGAGLVNALVEIAIFVAVFLRGGVYDPVLANILRALDAIPR
ncbi:MAG TPA: glycosyltransferase family 39 protein [Candidatus Limnocylindria bacterium]|nr:glycosyltransferase family 39 protein [Candidatus Limnocylindria bacterium]